MADHHKNWHNEFPNALGEGQVTPKAAIGNSLFFLVYEKEAILPPNIFLPSLQLAQAVEEVHYPVMQRLTDTLLKLEEECEDAKKKFHQHQMTIKWWFDDHSSPTET